MRNHRVERTIPCRLATLSRGETFQAEVNGGRGGARYGVQLPSLPPPNLSNHLHFHYLLRAFSQTLQETRSV